MKFEIGEVYYVRDADIEKSATVFWSSEGVSDLLALRTKFPTWGDLLGTRVRIMSGPVDEDCFEVKLLTDPITFLCRRDILSYLPALEQLAMQAE